MARKIRVAGGRSPWIPISAAASVMSALAEARTRTGARRVRCGRNQHHGWEVLGAGLLHTPACVSTGDAGSLLACHPSTAARRVRRHTTLLVSDAAYAVRAGVVAMDALDVTFHR